MQSYAVWETFQGAGAARPPKLGPFKGKVTMRPCLLDKKSIAADCPERSKSHGEKRECNPSSHSHVKDSRSLASLHFARASALVRGQ
jgi:hypothetical protein